jgi:hypothetical protein
MEISISTLRNDGRDGNGVAVSEPVSPGGQNDAPGAENVYETMMRRAADSGRTMGSYREAESLLMEVMMMAVKEGQATPLMVQMVDEVKQFFVEKNKPQTGVTNNYYMSDNSKTIQGNNVEGSYVDCHDNNDVGNEIKN